MMNSIWLKRFGVASGAIYPSGCEAALCCELHLSHLQRCTAQDGRTG
jgi:hypothetical protein